jgi:hypothetical protein
MSGSRSDNPRSTSSRREDQKRGVPQNSQPQLAPWTFPRKFEICLPSSSQPQLLQASPPSRQSGGSSSQQQQKQSQPPQWGPGPSSQGAEAAAGPSSQGIPRHPITGHVRGCRCRVCSPQLYDIPGSIRIKKDSLAVFARSPCAQGCRCYGCQVQADPQKWEEGCLCDGHKLAVELRCATRGCSCQVGCREAGCTLCESLPDGSGLGEKGRTGSPRGGMRGRLQGPKGKAIPHRSK